MPLKTPNIFKKRNPSEYSQDKRARAASLVGKELSLLNKLELRRASNKITKNLGKSGLQGLMATMEIASVTKSDHDITNAEQALDQYFPVDETTSPNSQHVNKQSHDEFKAALAYTHDNPSVTFGRALTHAEATGDEARGQDIEDLIRLSHDRMDEIRRDDETHTAANPGREEERRTIRNLIDSRIIKYADKDEDKQTEEFNQLIDFLFGHFAKRGNEEYRKRLDGLLNYISVLVHNSRPTEGFQPSKKYIALTVFQDILMDRIIEESRIENENNRRLEKERLKNAGQDADDDSGTVKYDPFADEEENE